MNEELNKSAVIFDEAAHTYHLDGVVLGGVTPIVKWVYPDTYKDIPESVLQKAAEHGSLIHKACQLYNEAGFADTDEPQVKDYVHLMCNTRLMPVASEYTVSDNENIASQIDVVYRGWQGGYILADIKTTSEIHEPNVTLQLSIYAWLFELNNPDKTVEGLAVVWLPKAKYGDATIMELKRIPTDMCQRIVASYLNNEDGALWAEMIASELGEKVPEAVPELKEEALPTKLAEAEKEIARIETEMKKMKDESTKLRAGLLELMQKHGVKKWTGQYVEFTRKAASVRKMVDSTKLKKAYPAIYNAVQKESNVAESLMIKIKDNGTE